MRLVLFLFAALFAGPAFAQAPATPAQLRDVYACRDIADPAQRLACFDAAVGRLAQAQQSGEFAAIDREGQAEVERDAFGFRLPSLSRLLPFAGDREAAPAPQSQQFEIARIVPLANGYHAFVMSNGQRWRQLEAQSARNVRAGQTVTIRRAALGSFLLIPDSGAAHRVRREE